MPRHAPAKSSQAAPQDALALDQQLCFALYATSLSMTKLYKPVLQPLGLTYPQYLVMLVLWEGQELGVSALGERVMLDSGTLTPLLKRLEAAGLVARLRDAADERRVRIALTRQGHALRQKAATVPRQMVALSGCTLDEVSRLTQRLHALRRQLTQAKA